MFISAYEQLHYFKYSPSIFYFHSYIIILGFDYTVATTI